MKKIKSLFLFLLCMSIMLGVSACVTTGPNPVEPTIYAVEVNDFSLELGTSSTITPKVTPVGTQGIYSYSLKSASPANCVTISNGIAQGHEAGTATFEITASNLPNAADKFTATDTFTVTVTEPQMEEGNLIMNGGFENAFYGWELAYPNENSSFKNEVTNNTAHGGVSALNLWSKVGSTGADGEESDELDLTLSQEVTVAEAGDYLLSLWFKGNIGTISFTVLDNEDEEVAFGSFETSSYAAFALPSEEDYIHFGINVTDLKAGTYTVKIQFVAEWANNWGFVDDVSLSKGSTDDLVRPNDPEIGQHNFVIDGNISADFAQNWQDVGTTAITRGTDGGGCISCWGTDFEFYQAINDLPKRDYNFVVKVIGPGNNYKVPTASYIYIADENGEIIQKQDFTLPGYSWTRLEMSGVELEGDVRVGVVIKFAQEAWAAFTGFSLYSEGYTHVKSDDATLTDIKIDGVAVTDDEVELEYLRYAALLESKADARNFVSGLLATRATITSAVFDDESGVLTVVVTAENGTSTNTYQVLVLQGEAPAEPQWVNVTIVNAGFEDSWELEGWVGTNTKQWCIDGASKHSGNQAFKGDSNITNPDELASIVQEVDHGFEAGSKIRVSVWISTTPDKASGIKLVAGEQSVAPLDMSEEWNWQQISVEFVLTAEDINEGKVTFGIEFVMADGGWINIDDFKLESFEIVE